MVTCAEMSPSRLPNDAVCIYSHSSVETTKSASVRMQFGYVIPIPANSCQCAKSVERRCTLVMHGVCDMSSSLHTITLSTRLSPTGHRGQLINLTCRVFHGNCEECISAFKKHARADEESWMMSQRRIYVSLIIMMWPAMYSLTLEA